MTLYTVGHSTRPLDEFLKVLHAHSIQILIDIRAFPVSRRMPHFNRESLEESLAKENIQYVWMKELGGRRKKLRDDSPNVALRNDSFRNYADYMLTVEFERGIRELLELADAGRTAYMCAERVYFRCHRMLVSDWLVVHGHEVLHIDATGAAQAHCRSPLDRRPVDLSRRPVTLSIGEDIQMIVGTGIDIAEVPRVAAAITPFGNRFLQRIYTEGEIRYCESKANRMERYAARFAAKEAAMKALGTGWNHGVRWRDVEVCRQPGGRPTIVFHGKAAECAARLGATHVALSLSHTAEQAIAQVILES